MESSVGTRYNFYFYVLGADFGELFDETVLEAVKHGVTAAGDDVGEEVAADVDVRFGDGFDDHLMNSTEAADFRGEVGIVLDLKRALVLEKLFGDGLSIIRV